MQTSRINGMQRAAVLAVVVSVAVAVLVSVPLGARILATVMLGLAFQRAVIRDRAVTFAVRGRVFDVLLLGGLGAVIGYLSFAPDLVAGVPPPPPA
ncbi:DUF3017 domain-containing protein [Serinibacter salmoneus]|uniref:DUF3017 family protein n=1 Tax=Serinibacter salmoneus TaxID=556530 RepID=A0A2A9CXA6_9MICO|nr:DUF3017 domain-containing protein [Serinibacter salmoneus]PFG19033.1 Protein of unknown function (DUF3017) [Serinibacter salmoneus]